MTGCGTRTSEIGSIFKWTMCVCLSFLLCILDVYFVDKNIYVDKCRCKCIPTLIPGVFFQAVYYRFLKSRCWFWKLQKVPKLAWHPLRMNRSKENKSKVHVIAHVPPFFSKVLHQNVHSLTRWWLNHPVETNKHPQHGNLPPKFQGQHPKNSKQNTFTKLINR